MIIDISKVKIYVYPGETDMRKQINGLSIRVQEDFGKELFSGALYLFCNKSRKRLKILYWDTNGFCLWIKRLEKDKFPWPRDRKEALEISSENLKMLLKGIDFFHAHKRLEYTNVV